MVFPRVSSFPLGKIAALEDEIYGITTTGVPPNLSFPRAPAPNLQGFVSLELAALHLGIPVS